MLHVNFKMLWQPVMELVKSHADHMTREHFWDVFGKQLEMAAELSGESTSLSLIVVSLHVLTYVVRTFNKLIRLSVIFCTVQNKVK